MDQFDHRLLQDLAKAMSLEWVETDGLGGFAMSTVVGANTRRYHGLLVGATQPPVGRRVLVAKVEDRLIADGDLCAMSCNQYEGAVDPEGYRCQEQFRLDPWPVFTWHDRGYRLEKSVFMPHELGITVIRYDLLDAPRPAWLHARPLVAGRDMHHLQRASNDFQTQAALSGHRLILEPYDPASRMMLDFPHGEFRADGLWYYNFRYVREVESGLDFIEDLYSPGEIVWLMRPGATAWLVLSQNGAPADFDGPDLMKQERKRRDTLLKSFRKDEVAGRLALAADQFIVKRTVSGKPSKTIIAGYPWFGDWGRDTMIALFGLTLTTKRFEDCRAMLSTFVAEMRNGLVPNLFMEAGEPSYNTVDATLWLFVAIRRYLQATRDMTLIREVWPSLKESLAAHVAGTDFGIQMTDDGLLTAGDPTTQLTWMDAKVEDWVVTPRHGKAVEINGLWYNALKVGEYLAGQMDEPQEARAYGQLARRTRAGFTQFWSPELGYCYDILRGEERDANLRPNQLIACSLPYHVLTPLQRRSILDKCTEQLLTPYGMRTLAAWCAGYCALYGGDRWARDAAYHQGTVWPWLLGPYLSTYFDVMGVSEDTRLHARSLVQPLIDHLDRAGLGSISEIFDAEEPYEPHGCIAQAWSVGEVLRCWVQYKLGALPELR